MKDTRILVLEDNEKFTHLLKVLLGKLGVTKVAFAGTTDQGWSKFKTFRPDVCLLDISMGEEEEDGIDLAGRIREANEEVAIIFLTSHYSEENYERAKKVRPTSFMSKKISALKIRQAIELAMQGNQVKEIPGVPPEPAPYEGRVFFRVGDSYKGVDTRTISFFYAEKGMSFGRIEKRNFPTKVPLKTLEKSLYPRFLRCHKSYLVNVSYITSVNTKDDKVAMGTDLLPIGDAYRKSFLAGLELLR